MAKDTNISIRTEYFKFRDLQNAFQEDCENLLLAYEKCDTFSFRTFAEVWRRAKFSLVFLGKYRSQEIGHFIEMMYNVVKKYMVFSRSRNVQVGALYLLYGLYYKQPFKHTVKIRLLQDEFAIMRDIIADMRSKRQVEAVYTHSEMLTDYAFDFVITQYSLGLEVKYMPVDMTLTNDIFPINRGNVVASIKSVNENVIPEIEGTEEKYRKLLKEYLGKNNKAMDTYEFTLTKDIKTIMTKETVSKEAAKEPDAKPGSSKSVGKRRADIKSKAFNTVKRGTWRDPILDLDDISIEDILYENT